MNWQYNHDLSPEDNAIIAIDWWEYILKHHEAECDNLWIEHVALKVSQDNTEFWDLINDSIPTSFFLKNQESSERFDH
jgi:hypothetical protein